ncbi:hypothetical protein AB0O76_10805 [Streptomyces sp. NPDC086554]|uniref:hypothetical protein n=1 Tax=Streptomyces sp. NPDC086554 TaxID=3154864 RepID=UPI003416C926
MFVARQALDGSRRYRLAVGMLLFLIMLVLSVGLTSGALGRGVEPLARCALGAAAVSVYAVGWWCARYWYAAFCEGRREEPVAEPHPWPWLLPVTVLSVTFLVSGVRQLGRGESGGWFSLGFGGFLAILAALGVAAAVSLRVGARQDARRAASRTAAAAEPSRPRRNWGPVG